MNSTKDHIKHSTATDGKPPVSGSYYWHCRFTFKGDNCDLYLTERNDCETFKQLRRWWRKEKPNLKLLSAVRK